MSTEREVLDRKIYCSDSVRALLRRFCADAQHLEQSDKTITTKIASFKDECDEAIRLFLFDDGEMARNLFLRAEQAKSGSDTEDGGSIFSWLTDEQMQEWEKTPKDLGLLQYEKLD